ncbi:MAG TPA: hypothetical protein VM260_18570 [Pirellula sp.]|nr:hypothetical protein [Pirellula sp.]
MIGGTSVAPGSAGRDAHTTCHALNNLEAQCSIRFAKRQKLNLEKDGRKKSDLSEVIETDGISNPVQSVVGPTKVLEANGNDCFRESCMVAFSDECPNLKSSLTQPRSFLIHRFPFR